MMGLLLGPAASFVGKFSSKKGSVLDPVPSWLWNMNEGGLNPLFLTFVRSFVALFVPSRSRNRKKLHAYEIAFSLVKAVM